jgi:L-lactate dehydrogenase complex protein LldE
MSKPSRVYFFGTCLIDMLYPNAGMAAITLLQREGLEVIFPQNQSCCGQPAFNSGYRDEALKVARSQLNLFKEAIPIVVPSASCGGMMLHHWPELFEGQPDHQQACDVAARVVEFADFLANTLQIALQDQGEPTYIAVHHSCSAQREMNVASATDKLLAQLNHVMVERHQRPTECCGFGGTFAIKQPDISGAMVEAKTQAICATSAKSVISQDCGCLMNITGYAEKQQHDLKGQHIAEFLLERTS